MLNYANNVINLVKINMFFVFIVQVTAICVSSLQFNL